MVFILLLYAPISCIIPQQLGFIFSAANIRLTKVPVAFEPRTCSYTLLPQTESHYEASMPSHRSKACRSSPVLPPPRA